MDLAHTMLSRIIVSHVHRFVKLVVDQATLSVILANLATYITIINVSQFVQQDTIKIVIIIIFILN